VKVSEHTAENGMTAAEIASYRDTVLIAEDDPIFRRILQSCLQSWNYRVRACENGLDAWRVLQQEHAPQLAILDWMMPGMDGIEICRRIRGLQQDSYRYVLLLSAKDDKHDVVQGLEAGADDYLTKPFDVDELHARVRAGKRILELQNELIQARESLRFEALHDHLTGVWNRGAVLNLLQREVQRRQRSGEALGVVMADVDHFKNINDSYGHLVGDAVLAEVARRLTASVRGYDSVGRYGGEEFLVIVPGCDPKGLIVSAERLRRVIADCPIDSSSGPIPVTLSVGLVSVDADNTEPVEHIALVQAADSALYRAKAGGRNRVEIAELKIAAE
jgi:two-component system, cell cycle response regulator